MLNRKTILVTGAAGRIGLAFTKFLIKNNYNLILVDIKIKKLKKILFKFDNKNYIVGNFNVNNFKKFDDFLKKSLKKFKKIDIAVNCAYPTSKKWGREKFEDKNLNRISENLRLQLAGPIIFSQKMLNIFNRQKEGNLILISSIMGFCAPKFETYKGTGMTASIEYGSIKAGIISIVKYLAKFCKNKNIRVNCISPGGILDKQPKKFINNYKKVCVSKGLISAIDLLPAFKYLIDENNKFVTGQNIIVDDGWSL